MLLLIQNQEQFIDDLTDERRRDVRIVSDRLPFGMRHVSSIAYEDGHNASVRRKTWKYFYTEQFGLKI